MRDIQDRFATLNSLYDRVIHGYQGLLSSGNEEQELILAGRTPELMSLLEKKTRYVGEVSKVEEAIESLQQWLATFFSLEQFSIPQLKTLSRAQQYQQSIQELDEKIRQLVLILETVEKQERAHEEMLRSYSEQLKAISEAKGHKPQALKAYNQWIEKNRD